jgi:hypothetical protein
MLQEHLLKEPHIRRREQMKIFDENNVRICNILLEGKIQHK